MERLKQIRSHISSATSSTNGTKRSHRIPYPGLSYHIGPTDKPLYHGTLGDLLCEQVSLNGDSEALVSSWQGIRWTYRELDKISDELARKFWALGVRKGDRIAIMAGNCGEYVQVFSWLLSKECIDEVDLLCCWQNRSYSSSHQPRLQRRRTSIRIENSW